VSLEGFLKNARTRSWLRITPFRNAANTFDNAVPLPLGQRSPFIRTKNCRGQGGNSKTLSDFGQSGSDFHDNP
jgi:hypothetical protein